MSMYYTVIVRHQRWYFLPSVHKHMQMKGFSLSVQSGWCKTTPQRLYGEKSCYWLIIQSTFSFFEPQDGSSWDFLNIIQIKMSGAYLFWSGQDAFLCWNFEMGNAKATRLTYICFIYGKVYHQYEIPCNGMWLPIRQHFLLLCINNHFETCCKTFDPLPFQFT